MPISLTFRRVSEHLTHLPLDKMAAISQTVFWYAFSSMKVFYIWVEILLQFVPKGSTGNNPALI